MRKRVGMWTISPLVNRLSLAKLCGQLQDSKGSESKVWGIRTSVIMLGKVQTCLLNLSTHLPMQWHFGALHRL